MGGGRLQELKSSDWKLLGLKTLSQTGEAWQALGCGIEPQESHPNWGLTSLC